MTITRIGRTLLQVPLVGGFALRSLNLSEGTLREAINDGSLPPEVRRGLVGKASAVAAQTEPSQDLGGMTPRGVLAAAAKARIDRLTEAEVVQIVEAAMSHPDLSERVPPEFLARTLAVRPGLAPSMVRLREHWARTVFTGFGALPAVEQDRVVEHTLHQLAAEGARHSRYGGEVHAAVRATESEQVLARLAAAPGRPPSLDWALVENRVAPGLAARSRVVLGDTSDPEVAGAAITAIAADQDGPMAGRWTQRLGREDLLLAIDATVRTLRHHQSVLARLKPGTGSTSTREAEDRARAAHAAISTSLTRLDEIARGVDLGQPEAAGAVAEALVGAVESVTEDRWRGLQALHSLAGNPSISPAVVHLLLDRTDEPTLALTLAANPGFPPECAAALHREITHLITGAELARVTRPEHAPEGHASEAEKAARAAMLVLIGRPDVPEEVREEMIREVGETWPVGDHAPWIGGSLDYALYQNPALPMERRLAHFARVMAPARSGEPTPTTRRALRAAVEGVLPLPEVRQALEAYPAAVETSLLASFRDRWRRARTQASPAVPAQDLPRYHADPPGDRDGDFEAVLPVLLHRVQEVSDPAEAGSREVLKQRHDGSYDRWVGDLAALQEADAETLLERNPAAISDLGLTAETIVQQLAEPRGTNRGLRVAEGRQVVDRLRRFLASPDPGVRARAGDVARRPSVLRLRGLLAPGGIEASAAETGPAPAEPAPAALAW